jgi:proline dehydrogenase
MRLWQQSMIFLARNPSMKHFMQNRATMSDLAMRFVGGKDVAQAAEKSQALKAQGVKASLFYLGEYVEDVAIINQTVWALKAIAGELAAAKLDVHISVDPTQIGYQLDEKICRTNAIEIATEIRKVARDSNGDSKNFLMLDMEDSSVAAATIGLYEALIEASLPAALTLQAYLFRTEADLQSIVRRGGAVRLVKGAFAEGKVVAFTGQAAIDENFMKLTALMFSDPARQSGFYPIFATHDDQLIEKIIAMAERRGWKKEAYEFEMLYGVRIDLQQKLVDRGEQLRLYLPFGTDWWPYAVRRVGESPKNARFLLRSLIGS